MKSILTVYHGPGNVRGSRIIADDGDHNRITVPYESAVSIAEMHARAALALCRKMGWKGRLQGGHVRHGMVWSFIDKHNQITAK